MKIQAVAFAALLSVALPALAFAVNTPGAPAAPGKLTNGANAGAASDMDTSADFGAFLQTLEGADYTNATAGLDTATSFKVMKLSSSKGTDAAKLQGTVTLLQKSIAGLDTQISTNAKAMAALDAEGLKSSDVVWVNISADGAVTLYVNDLSGDPK